MNHLREKRYHRLSYVHIFLLLIVFYLYNITTFNRGEDTTIPINEAPIVIENEPQIIPDQPQAETIMPEGITHAAPAE
jgi:hypothetical protein